MFRSHTDAHLTGRTTRRHLLLGAGAGLGAIAAAACGAQPGAGTTTGEATSATKQPATVVLETYSSQAEFENWKAQADRIHQKYPSITVEPAFVSDPYTRWTAAMAAGTGPDVMEFETKRMASFAEKGLLLDLTPYAAKSTAAKKADFLDADWEKTLYKGKQWLLVAMSKPAVFFYNTDLLKRIGIDSLTTRWGDPAWTWEKFEDLCRKLTTGAGPSAQFAYDQSSWWVYMQPFVWSNGGDFVNKDRTGGAVDQPEAIEALERLHDLNVKDKAMPKKINNPEGGPSFQNGRVAIQHNNSGFWIGLRQVQDLKWNIAPVPTGKKGTIARNPPNGWANWSGTKVKDAAWLVDEELTVPEALHNIEGVPSRKAQAEKGDFASAEYLTSIGGTWQVFIDAKKNSRDEPSTQYFQDLDATISKSQDAFWNNEMAVKDWAARLKTKIDAVQQGQGLQDW
jgi:multiple sugar transport system substrate-binding protein